MTKNIENVEGLSLTEVADAIMQGDLSAEQVTAQCLDRLSTHGSRLNCTTFIDADRALEVARQKDIERRSGKSLPPLHGVPLAHKEIFNRIGWPARYGSKFRAQEKAVDTATVLERLDAAGAIDLGQLHMAEFALSPTGYNEHLGHGLNPWNTAYPPGGSSSGSGAAVAARLVYGSLGTDTGGSIRHPAGMSGVVGLKPTWSRVSRAGAMPLSWSLDCIGPIARTVKDCARLMHVISGQDRRDASSSAMPVPDYESALVEDLKDKIIAVPQPYYFDQLDSSVEAGLLEAIKVFESLGARILRTRVPDMHAINTLMHLVMSVEAATIHRQWLRERPEDYAFQVRQRIEPGLYYMATDYCDALAMRAALTQEWIDLVIADADLALIPTMPIPVPSIKDTTEGDPAQVAAAIGRVTHCTRGINYLGLPSLSLPCGFVNDLPIAFQLVGRPFSESTLLAFGHAYQGQTQWHEKAPRLS